MNNKTPWATPTPLRGNRSNFMEFPVNALPPILREMAYSIARTTSTDVAMAGTAILSSISYCFSGQFRIVGKKDHSEPLVIDSLIVAEASFKKSPVMKLVQQPYQDYVREYNENNKAVILQNQAKKKVIANKLAALEKDPNADTKEMSDLSLQLSSITNADFRRIVVDDITPESLVRQLSINGTLLMMSDEAGSLGNFNGRYSNNSAPNLDLLLKSWNGETFVSDRITRESVILYKPYVSICLACQPYIWDSMIGNMAFRGSGFLARLVYCFPKDLRGSRRYDTEPIPDGLAANYHNLIYALLNYKFQRFELGQTDEKLLFLDEEAKAEYVFLHDEFVEKQLVTDMAFCSDWGGKFHGLVLSLCGIIHCIKCLLNDQKPGEVKISHDTMCNAIEIGHYFRLQAIYAYSLGDTDNQTLQAERILAKVRSKNISEIRQNELYKICRCKLFKNAQEFGEVISQSKDRFTAFRVTALTVLIQQAATEKVGERMSAIPSLLWTDLLLHMDFKRIREMKCTWYEKSRLVYLPVAVGAVKDFLLSWLKRRIHLSSVWIRVVVSLVAVSQKKYHPPLLVHTVVLLLFSAKQNPQKRHMVYGRTEIQK